MAEQSIHKTTRPKTILVVEEEEGIRSLLQLALTNGGFQVLLSGNGQDALKLYQSQSQNIDLMLSGHNHGGQVRFPLVGSVLVPSRYGRRYDCGTFDEPPTVLHVCRGLAGQHPLRYNCRPEVTKLVLTR